MSGSSTLHDRAFITRYPLIMGKREREHLHRAFKKREHLHSQDPASILCPKRGSVRAQTAQEDLEQLSWSVKESLPTCYIWLNHMLTLHVVWLSKD